MFIYYNRTHSTFEADRKLQEIARKLRNHPTAAEARLWIYLRKKQQGYKFRRQFVLYNYIVDFYCSELKLIIEVDGTVHESRQEHDQVRAKFLEDYGYQILRFTNNQVMYEIDKVLTTIFSSLNKGRDVR